MIYWLSGKVTSTCFLQVQARCKLNYAATDVLVETALSAIRFDTFVSAYRVLDRVLLITGFHWMHCKHTYCLLEQSWPTRSAR